MKKVIVIFMVFALLYGTAIYANGTNINLELPVTMPQLKNNLDLEMNVLEDNLEEMEELSNELTWELSQGIFQKPNVSVKVGDKSIENIAEITMNYSDTPLMGVYLADLDFQDAYEMHYDYNYGVLIKGVVPGRGAQKAGLIGGDIIMEFGGDKARFEDQLSRLIKSKKVGDVVPVKYFRDGKIYTTNVTLTSREKKVTPEGEVKVVKKRHISVGFGGGGWIPVWFAQDNKFEDINDLIDKCGFREIGEDGIFLNGFGGKGQIGKGWFIGGMGAWYSSDYRKTVPEGGVKRMKFSTSYGGVTLDKRFPISRKFTPALGFMLGWGGYTLEFSQIGEDYNWSGLDTLLVHSNNNFAMLKKSYILFQPKFALQYRINSWLGIRAEVGYMLSYSYHKGWNDDICGDSFEVEDSPDTKFNGITYTIGPWFGF